MDNMKLYNAVSTTPNEAKKQIKGGRISGFTDINPMYRIRRLTEQFGPCGIGWYYTCDRKWTEQAGQEILCFVDISLYIKVDGEWSKPIHGTGGSKILTQEAKGSYASDEGYKMATTDAISVACKQLGIGADVYWESGESKYRKPEAKVQVTQPDAEVKRRGEAIKTICAEFGRPIDDYTEVARVTKAKNPREMTDTEFKEHMATVRKHFEAAA